MVKIIKSRIVVFAISIALSYLLPVIYQDILGFILILSIGVIHGANDLLIIKKYTRKNSLKSQISYFLYYLGLVFLGFVFFYLFLQLHYYHLYWSQFIILESNIGR